MRIGRRSDRVRRTAPALLLTGAMLLVGHAIGAADDGKPPAGTTGGETAAAPGTAAPPDAAPPVFVPSETVSADKAVSFPTDI